MARPLLAVYAVLLAIALLAPSSTTQAGLVVRVGHLLAHAGVPVQWVVFNRTEVVMNALIVAPLALLGSLVFPSSRWQDWTAWTFVGASMVELIQGVFLPARHASFSDIVANTAGAALGALLVAVVRWARNRGAPRAASG